jgi:hypothetical protein
MVASKSPPSTSLYASSVLRGSRCVRRVTRHASVEAFRFANLAFPLRKAILSSFGWSHPSCATAGERRLASPYRAPKLMPSAARLARAAAR